MNTYIYVCVCRPIPLSKLEQEVTKKEAHDWLLLREEYEVLCVSQALLKKFWIIQSSVIMIMIVIKNPNKYCY